MKINTAICLALVTMGQAGYADMTNINSTSARMAWLGTMTTTNLPVTGFSKCPWDTNKFSFITNTTTLLDWDSVEMVYATNTVVRMFWKDGNHWKADDSVIKDMAASGELCRVLGHQWRDGRVGEGGAMFLDSHPNTTYRHCGICEKTEAKTISEWK